MAATLELDTTQVDEALAKVKALDASVRGIGQGGGAGVGGGGGGAAETGKSFRQWDTELRHVEHTGRGLLALFGVGGGILGAAHLITKEISDWHARMTGVATAAAALGSVLARGSGTRQQVTANWQSIKSAGLDHSEAVDPECNLDWAKISRGQREMAQLKRGAAMGGVPERMELAQRIAKTNAAEAGLGLGSALATGREVEATEYEIGKRANVMALKRRGFSVSPKEEKEGLTDFETFWRSGFSSGSRTKLSDKNGLSLEDEIRKAGQELNVNVDWHNMPQAPSDSGQGN